MDNSKGKNQLNEDLSFPEQKITEVEVEHEVKQSFIEYAMSVIMSRALPDVRDGLKPGQRRILYAMYEDHLTHDHPFLKSATTVGDVLGRYHPHGDAAVYGTMVRMAQPFSMRHPLIEGHGNFGSVDGDPPAAYRYTEARLERIADEMLRDLDENAVEMVPNFDNRLKEPAILPSRFPNFLVNGAVGIAVGMATNVPPHNLGEVIDATVYRIEHPDCTVEELMQFIKGPDFPTYGTIHGTRGIKEAYETGKGRIYVRAKATVEEEHHRIIVTEIPFMVNKSLLCENIANLVKEKRIEGITDMRDESGRAGMRIVIEYRRDANGEIILNQLYKYTQLQDTCSVNMLALVGTEPKILNLQQVLDYYIAHQEKVITRRSQFRLEKAKTRAHILEGYHIALTNIDRIYELIRSSRSIPEAKERLKNELFTVEFADGYVEHNLDPALVVEGNLRHLSDEQAQAIVDMPLGRLTGMERDKIEEELARLHANILELEAILGDIEKVREIIRTEMLEIKDKYANPRRTRIEEAIDDIKLEDLIERHTCVITMTHSGYIKRLPADTYSAQRRGGKGLNGMTLKEEDFLEKVIAVDSHSILLLFTNFGRVYAKRAFEVPEADRTAKGKSVQNLLELQPEERITTLLSVSGFSDEAYLTMVTRRGVIKRTVLSAFAYQRKGGKKAITLQEGDELLFVRVTHGQDELILATHEGRAIRFSEEAVRSMGRSAAGVRGIRLSGDDYVVGVTYVEPSKKLVSITENGFGKMTEYEQFRLMKTRGNRGVVAHKLTAKTGKLAGIASVDETEDLMLMTNEGQIIRFHVSDIPVHARATSGVIIMRLADGQKIANFTKVAEQEEKTEETGTGELLQGEGAQEEFAEENPSDLESMDVEEPDYEEDEEEEEEDEEES